MCGISGIINKDGTRVTHDELAQITDLIAHRGPDGQGIFRERNVGLGHRRLAIFDLSPAGQQPMNFMDRYVIVYNGEIYNYLEIKEDLRRAGYCFRSETDTEVILAAYDKWGSNCVSRFNGMWAFALYDRAKEIIFCSRDRFGIKPFYYSSTGGHFVFGSEIKQIISFKGTSAVANMRMVRDFLVEGYHEHTGDTFFEGVRKLRAGHNLVFSLRENQLREAKYYALTVQPGLPQLDEKSATELLLTELERSITYQLRSDVKVGACLSGGLDSSSMAALSSRAYRAGSTTRMQAIHARSSDRQRDESCYAQALAIQSGIELSVIEPTLENFIETLDEVVYCQEEPFLSPSIFMQYFVCKEAKRIGCKVMLDGQGCDEILLGYERYYPTYLRSLPLIQAIKELHFIQRNSRLSYATLLAYLLYFSSSRFRIKNLKRKFSFLKDEYVDSFPNIEELYSCGSDIREMQKMEIESFQLPHLLRYLDKNSMQHSIEARVPFLDHQFVETCYSISNRLKIKNGWTKYALRVAMKDHVASDILWRKFKFGFEAPTGTWMKEIRGTMELVINESLLLKEMCKEQMDFSTIDGATFWKLYSVAKWEAVYSVASAAQVPVAPKFSQDETPQSEIEGLALK